MYKFLSLIFFTNFLFSQINIYDINNYNFKSDSLITSSIPMLKSFVVPGWGQIENNDPWWKPALFLGVEIVGLASARRNYAKGNDSQYKFEDYGDKHWTLKRWYNNTQIIFPNNWKEILIGTHKLMLKIDGIYYYTDSLDDLSLKYDWQQISVIRDRDFYENIGKYDQFVGGWDDDYDNPFDNDGNWYSEKKRNVESVILTIKKNQYRSMRHESNVFKNYVRYSFSAIMANHLISSIDAAFASKKNMEKNSTIKFKFSAINKLSVSGFQIVLMW